MTCIIGLIQDDVVRLAGDRISAAPSQYFIENSNAPKVFSNGEFIIGYTTSFRFGDILQYKFKAPALALSDRDPTKHMKTLFVDELRKVLKDEGYAEVSNNRENGGQMLVGVRGRLFVVQDDFAVIEPQDNYTAIGCGRDYALASLYTSDEYDVDTRIQLAMGAAHKYSAYVSKKYDTIMGVPF